MIISRGISRSLRRSDLILGKWGFCFPVSHSCVSSAECVSSAVVPDSKSCVLAPSTKSEKKVRSILEGLCETENSMYWKSEDDAGALGGLEWRQLIHCWCDI